MKSYRQDHVNNDVSADLEAWNYELKKNNLHEYISILRKTNFSLGILNYVLDWIIILLSIYLSIVIPMTIPICLIIIGSRQRALSNLIHDSSHWNLTRNKKLNDVITDIFAGFAMLSPIKTYRRSHLFHHKFLGDTNLDPDLRMHARYEYDDAKPPYSKWYKNILHLIFNFNSWIDSNFGSLQEMNVKQKIAVIIWWLSFFGLISYIHSTVAAIYCIMLWQLARATSYHVIRTIAEFLDHSGLEGGSISRSTRFIESPNLILKILIHPHNDNCHALHHFDPAIPQYNLLSAQKIIERHLSHLSKIRKNKSYFFGKEAAIKDLVRLV